MNADSFNALDGKAYSDIDGNVTDSRNPLQVLHTVSKRRSPCRSIKHDGGK